MMEQFDTKPAVILLAEDNPADQEITRRALEDAKVKNDLHVVGDGVEAMEYLRRQGKYSDSASSPRPDLLLLDINMPKMDGKQVLEKIKGDEELRTIPVVMLTTSSHERDVIKSYHLGVNAYILKPVDIGQFVAVLKNLEEFWFMMVVLPSKSNI
ncbi:MAG: two-component system response regulator [bacterium]|nr:MAG: two-component system response regulator [bacterium]